MVFQQSQRALAGLDLTRNNPRDIIYVKGNDTLDGSIRITFDAGDDSAHIESRADGVWNDAGFRVSSSSVEIGRDMKMSAVGAFVETVNQSEMVGHLKSLIPHIQFDEDGTLTRPGRMPIVDALETFVIFAGPATGETVGTSIGQGFPSSNTRVLESVTHTTGSVAATSQVEVSYYKGTDNTGTLVNRFNIPSSTMPADTDFTITYDSDFGFRSGDDVFVEFVSDEDISLATNTDGDVITSQDGHALNQLDIMLDEFVLGNDLSIAFDNDLNVVVHNRF